MTGSFLPNLGLADAHLILENVVEAPQSRSAFRKYEILLASIDRGDNSTRPAARARRGRWIAFGHIAHIVADQGHGKVREIRTNNAAPLSFAGKELDGREIFIDMKSALGA
jgi:hypothetical protein